MIKIILIILSVIGSLKLLSLCMLALLQIYYYIKGNNVIEAHRDSCFYIEDNFCIFPTVAVSHTTKYVEVMVHWLFIKYYEATCLEFKNEEKDEKE